MPCLFVGCKDEYKSVRFSCAAGTMRLQCVSEMLCEECRLTTLFPNSKKRLPGFTNAVDSGNTECRHNRQEIVEFFKQVGIPNDVV